MRHLTLALLSSVAVLVAGAATAADMPVKAAPRPVMVAPAFSWTGFYLGVNGGWGWGNSKRELLGLAGSFDIDGALAGGQVGFNYQFAGSGFVLGFEADYQWANIEGTAGIFPANLSVELQRFGTARGRLGWAWDRFMIYATGGWAFGARTEVTLGPGILGAPLLSVSQDRSGWTAGAGIEWAFAPNWSAKLEYLHIDLDNKQIFGPLVCGPLAGCRSGADIDLIRVGVNWRLGTLFGTP